MQKAERLSFQLSSLMNEISRVVYRFGILGQYRLDQRKTRLVHFGIKTMAGAPFTLRGGGFCPLFVHFTPLLSKKGIPTDFSKQKVFPPKLTVHK
jgi:hypothetical protein